MTTWLTCVTPYMRPVKTETVARLTLELEYIIIYDIIKM